ncbi:c4a6f69a-8fcb-43d4-bf14-4a41024e0945 [Thermothielavioides terrestris]|uniref:C4a6f69a-8fcb-43d4-bf14-4a41024e0945 n=1 Tax=Thermothielavioides terrestris TaxID=2587410 RepID=A0A3S4AUK9_9PEZI|nr:c4a6f69a-8fcb-43d4-bf14-4a41024e0945 [Thermothielavioides terrestris]
MSILACRADSIVAVVMLFNILTSVGLLAIPWLLRAEAAALATASNRIFTFLAVEITPVNITSIQWRTYIYFRVFNFAFIPLITSPTRSHEIAPSGRSTV